MKTSLIAICVNVAWLVIVHGWPDCSVSNDAHVPYNGTQGPFGPVNKFNATWEKKPIVVHVPTGDTKGAPLPVLAFMHGITAEIAMYEPNLELYASHGFAVIFPYIQGPKIDKLPITTNTNGEYLLHAVAYAEAANQDKDSPLFGKLDLSKIVVSGHSMGATCSIMAGKRLQALSSNASIQLVVTQHPGICGPIGPPPWPSTWFESDLKQVLTQYPVLFTTATNDGAFWPAPHTAEHELGCFHGATKELPAGHHPATFVQFSAAACNNDGAREPFDDSGHDCAFKNDVETPWVLTAAKLYAQQGGRKDSACHAMLYGSDQDSIAKDKHVEKIVQV